VSALLSERGSMARAKIELADDHSRASSETALAIPENRSIQSRKRRRQWNVKS
jgi:hypothetical protein